MENRVKHSVYRGYQIMKVAQESGRVTHDTATLVGSPVYWDAPTLKMARLDIAYGS